MKCTRNVRIFVYIVFVAVSYIFFLLAKLGVLQPVECTSNIDCTGGTCLPNNQCDCGPGVQTFRCMGQKVSIIEQSNPLTVAGMLVFVLTMSIFYVNECNLSNDIVTEVKDTRRGYQVIKRIVNLYYECLSDEIKTKNNKQLLDALNDLPPLGEGYSNDE